MLLVHSKAHMIICRLRAELVVLSIGINGFGRFAMQFFILLSEDFRVVTLWFGVQCGLQIPARLDIFQLCYMCHPVSRMICTSLAKVLLEHAEM